MTIARSALVWSTVSTGVATASVSLTAAIGTTAVFIWGFADVSPVAMPNASVARFNSVDGVLVSKSMSGPKGRPIWVYKVTYSTPLSAAVTASVDFNDGQTSNKIVGAFAVQSTNPLQIQGNAGTIGQSSYPTSSILTSYSSGKVYSALSANNLLATDVTETASQAIINEAASAGFLYTGIDEKTPTGTNGASTTITWTLATPQEWGEISISVREVTQLSLMAPDASTSAALAALTTLVTTRFTNLDNQLTNVGTGVTSINTSLGSFITGTTTRFNSVDGAISTVSTQVGNVKTVVDGIATNVASARTDISSVSTQVGGVSTQVTGLTTRFNTIDTATSFISTQNTNARAVIDSTSTAVGTLSTNQATRFTTVDTNVAAVKTVVDSINTTVVSHNTRFNTIDTNIGAVSTQITSRLNTVDTATGSIITKIDSMRGIVDTINSTTTSTYNNVNTLATNEASRFTTVNTKLDSLDAGQAGLGDYLSDTMMAKLNGIQAIDADNNAKLVALGTAVSGLGQADTNSNDWYGPALHGWSIGETRKLTVSTIQIINPGNYSLVNRNRQFLLTPTTAPSLYTYWKNALQQAHVAYANLSSAMDDSIVGLGMGSNGVLMVVCHDSGTTGSIFRAAPGSIDFPTGNSYGLGKPGNPVCKGASGTYWVIPTMGSQSVFYSSNSAVNWNTASTTGLPSGFYVTAYQRMHSAGLAAIVWDGTNYITLRVVT
jgi:hypothetical protein